MNWEFLLIVWTICGAAWWGISLLLVTVPRRPRPVDADAVPDPRRISVFKSLATPVGDAEMARFAGPLESFVAELDGESELLIGCHTPDEPRLRAFVDGLRERHPGADVRLVAHPDPSYDANPKIAWMRILSRHATGELWYWSDADIHAPAGTLASLRRDFGAAGGGMVTSPYAICRQETMAGIFDKLFVNLEFYPGVLLLERLDQIRFGFGSGMLFEAAAFREKVDWDFLGSCLADDFHLGQLLAPTRLGSTRLGTSPAAPCWRGAILHYLRWQKTIRWCRPGSYASQGVIVPVVGWLLWVLGHPTGGLAWFGLLATVGLDTVAAMAICGGMGCPIPWRRLPAVPLWSLGRGLTWIACWFPWPIIWSGRKWESPYQRTATHPRMLETKREPGLDG